MRSHGDVFAEAALIAAHVRNTVAVSVAILAPAHEASPRFMMSIAIPVSVYEVRPTITIPVAVPLGLMNGSAHSLTEIPKPRGSRRRFACVRRRRCGFGDLIPHLSARTMAVAAQVG